MVLSMRYLHPSVAILAMTVALGCSKGEAAKADQTPPPAARNAEPPPSAATAPVPITPTTATVVATPPDFASMPEYKFDKANSESHCREQWTKRGELDSQMFNHCVADETKGHAEMLQALKKFGKQPWMASLFPAIWAEWTKRGVTQYRMVAYGLKKEGDKFLDYEYEQKQPSFNAGKMSRCEQQWRSHASRWTMTMHCYKQD